MKKLRTFYLSLLAVSSLGFLASCGDDSDDVIPNENPSIEFIGGTGFTSADQSVAAGTEVTSKVTAKSSTETGKNLERFQIKVQFDNGIETTYLDSTGLKGESFDYTNTFPTRGVAGTEKWTYIITDNAGRSASSSYTITTTSTSTGTLNNFSTQLLGSFDNPNPGFFSTTQGKRYFRNTAVNNQSAIDFVYFYGASNQATLAAPNDPDANTISALRLNTWTTKNATTFKETGLTPAMFDAITDTNAMGAAYDLGTATSPASRANLLAKDDVIAFKTSAGKRGLIKVRSIATGAAGSITIDVKVEK